MTSRKTIACAMALFLSGAVFGAVSLHVLMRFHVLSGFRREPRSMTNTIMRQLDRKLDLDAAQREELLPIVEEMHLKFKSIRRENRPRLEAVIDEAVQKAEGKITEQQRERLRELRARVKEHFERDSD